MMCRDVSGDDAASANDAAGADGDARENDCAAACVLTSLVSFVTNYGVW